MTKKSDEQEVLTCGICGAKSEPFPKGETPVDIMMAWYPYAFLKGKEVSPVCPKHKVRRDPKGGVNVVGEKKGVKDAKV